MVAGDVVPLDAIVVDVVQQAHARLHAAVDVELGVVRLRYVFSLELGLVAGEGPGLVAPAGWGGVGGGHLHSGPGPKPAVDVCWLQVIPVAALEVAEPARCPDIGQVVLLEKLSDHLLLGGSLQAHQVHAVFTADVTAVKPVNLYRR